MQNYSVPSTILPQRGTNSSEGNQGNIEAVQTTATTPHETLVQSNDRLKENEQRLRLALESGRLGSWDLDLETKRYLDISDIWKAHFGRPDVGDHITQEEFLLFLHLDDRERVHQAAQHAVETCTDYSTEYRAVWPDGSVHWIRAHAKLLYDRAGEPRRMIGVTEDITEQKSAEAKRERELQEAVEQADRDPLTALLNHRAFHRRLGEEIARARREGTALAVVMLDLDNFKFFNDSYGHVTGDDVLRQVADKLQERCRSYDTVARFGGDEFVLLLPNSGEAAADEIKARVRADLSSLTYCPDGQASPIPLTVSIGVALFPQESQERAGLMELADERLFRSKTGGESETQAEQVRFSAARDVEGFSMLDALVTAVDNKDRYTSRHSEDVMKYGLMIARELGIDESQQRTVAMAALLHDVGKIGVPDSILRKPGKLTEQEFAAVKQHPQMGAIMVSSVAGLEETLPAVRHHHERWDGGGYPGGLREEETPSMARLMAVADAFSAMTTDRPYRQGMSHREALSILEAGAGTQWDPRCIAAFLAAMHGLLAVPD
ncbi:MAG: bifunctional diguanylate cyclase/phosphohydrolase [Janthinobacterium lividum]